MSRRQIGGKRGRSGDEGAVLTTVRESHPPANASKKAYPITVGRQVSTGLRQSIPESR